MRVVRAGMRLFVSSTVGSVLGISIGILAFNATYVVPFGYSITYDDRFNGIVKEFDAQNHTLVVSMQSVFPQSPNGDVQFSYDSRSLWGSYNFKFDGDTLHDRQVVREVPRDLPVGTLITIKRDVRVNNPLRAAVIIFYRRDSI